ncbi:MAG: hypothetical protein AAFZ58_10115 [Pseudomonadota bacterium]
MSDRLFPTLLSPRGIAWFWAGALVGLYVIEFPVRFTAPEIDYANAIGVGARVFARLNVAEWALLGTMVVFALIARSTWRFWIAGVVIAALLGFETFVLLPELTTRAAEIVAAGSPEPSSAHRIYSSLELVKAAALAFVAIGPR